MTKPRQFTLKDQAPASIAYGSACRQGSRSDLLKLDVGGAGDALGSADMAEEVHVLPEGGAEMETATREWLRHVEAGRIG